MTWRGAAAKRPPRVPCRLLLAALLIAAWGLLSTCKTSSDRKIPSPSASGPAQATTPPAQVFEPFIFIHASDPHMGLTTGANRRFAELARQVNTLKPAFVLVAGDMTHGLTERKMTTLEAALKQFKVPVRFVPGNHDVRDHERLQTWRRRYGKDYYVFTHNNCDFICLNSMTLSRDSRFFKNRDDRFQAEVKAQWAWLEKTLASSKAARRDHVFILLHVPPFVKSQGERHKYTNMPAAARKRLLTLAHKFGVHVLLAGHVHKTKEIRTGDLTIYTVGGTYRPIDLRSYGYRVFEVSKDTVTQRYVRLRGREEQ